MTKPIDTLLTALSIARRRRILSVLADHDGPLCEDRLATLVTSREADSEDALDAARREVRLELHHVHLPALVAGGLVEHDRDAGTVAATDHRLFEWGPAAEALDEPEAVTATEERIFESLSHQRRRTVAAILRESGRACSLEELGSTIAERGSGSVGSPTADELVVTLHHADLPKLADAGLAEYDVESKTVSFRDGIEFDDEWLDETTWNRGRAYDSTRGEASRTPT